MTLQELVTAIADETGHPSALPAPVTTRLRRYVNEGVRAVLAEPGLQRLADSDQPYSFSTTASQARYVVPESIARILSITERTNDWALTPMGLEDYRLREPDPATVTGTPTHYVPIGPVALATPLADASEVFVDSTSASDTATALVEGVITGGYRRKASVTMTGTTGVSLNSSITSWTDITDFYLSAPAVGTVTLTEDAEGGTELARITIGQTRPRYYGFYLWPTPAAAVTYYVDAQRPYQPLVQDSDEPPFAAEFHDAVAAYGAFREWEQKNNLERSAQALERYTRWLSRLKYATQTLPGELPVAGRGARIGRSRLGAYYPADTWTRG